MDFLNPLIRALSSLQEKLNPQQRDELDALIDKYTQAGFPEDEFIDAVTTLALDMRLSQAREITTFGRRWYAAIQNETWWRRKTKRDFGQAYIDNLSFVEPDQMTVHGKKYIKEQRKLFSVERKLVLWWRDLYIINFHIANNLVGITDTTLGYWDSILNWETVVDLRNVRFQSPEAKATLTVYTTGKSSSTSMIIEAMVLRSSLVAENNLETTPDQGASVFSVNGDKTLFYDKEVDYMLLTDLRKWMLWKEIPVSGQFRESFLLLLGDFALFYGRKGENLIHDLESGVASKITAERIFRYLYTLRKKDNSYIGFATNTKRNTLRTARIDKSNEKVFYDFTFTRRLQTDPETGKERVFFETSTKEVYRFDFLRENYTLLSVEKNVSIEQVTIKNIASEWVLDLRRSLQEYVLDEVIALIGPFKSRLHVLIHKDKSSLVFTYDMEKNMLVEKLTSKYANLVVRSVTDTCFLLSDKENNTGVNLLVNGFGELVAKFTFTSAPELITDTWISNTALYFMDPLSQGKILLQNLVPNKKLSIYTCFHCNRFNVDPENCNTCDKRFCSAGCIAEHALMEMC